MKLIHAALLAACLAGCAGPALKPAPEANLLTRNAAIAAGGNVQMVARAGAWQGMPPNLEQALTPMLVTVTNDSAHGIRLDYRHLELVAADGRSFRAIPPHSISGSVTVALDELGYGPSYAAPYEFGAPFASGPAFWGPSFRDHPYWAPHGRWSATRPVWREVRLPTVDMLRRALPEGVLEPGAAASGFVYFEPLRGELHRLELRAEFPSRAGEPVTRLEIPFVLG